MSAVNREDDYGGESFRSMRVREADPPPRPILVGESNPHSDRESNALYVLPPNAAGARLVKILGLTKERYLEVFDRTNLCARGWDLDEARDRACTLLQLDKPLILLGSKVCSAFRVEFAPFTFSSRTHMAILPHPSGRSRIWNDPRSYQHARDTLRKWL